MRTLIANDEAPARKRLRQLLLSHPLFEIVGEARTGAEALELASATKAEVLLLDIQMPGGDGLEVASRLPEPKPAIIFCTVHDEHAVDAFELYAVDDLLKPVSRARLAQELDRVRGADTPTAGAGVARFLVRRGAHYEVVPASQVAHFESIDGLTRLVTASWQAYRMNPPLQDLEEKLNSREILRISRNAMVHPVAGGAAEVMLRGGARFVVSRRRFRALMDALD